MASIMVSKTSRYFLQTTLVILITCGSTGQFVDFVILVYNSRRFFSFQMLMSVLQNIRMTVANQTETNA